MTRSPEAGPRGGADLFGGMLDQMGEQWSAVGGMWSAVLGSWQSMLTNRGVPAAQAMVGRMLSPAAWPEGIEPLLDELRQIFALPQFSDLPALDPAALPSLAPAGEFLAAANQFMLAAVPLWLRACQRFQAEVVARRRNDASTIDSAGDALDVWNTVLDKTLMEFNRSSAFAAMQQRLLRAAMLQKQQTRRFGEQLAQSVDLPTRSELDDVYRRLHDLLREVHGLRRELRSVKRGAAQTVPAEAGSAATQIPSGAEPKVAAKARPAGRGAPGGAVARSTGKAQSISGTINGAHS